MESPPGRRHPLLLAVIPFVLTILCPASGRLVAQVQPTALPQKPTFRTGITVVPIDVRVVDRDGRPVADLTRNDFTVYEDNVPQRIVHFAPQVLAPQPPGPNMRARAEVPSFDEAPRPYRVFLIVIGTDAFGSAPVELSTGYRIPELWAEAPSKAFDGLLHLLRERLLPQDQVALVAFNRATDFTSDHERVARTIEAFRRSQSEGRAALASWSTETPVAAPAKPVFQTADDAQLGELGFAEYRAAAPRAFNDLDTLYYGIKYLKFVEGEKHLLYVTAQGIVQPEPGTLEPGMRPYEPPDRLAKAASDARVAVHPIQTGGISAVGGAFLAQMPVNMPRILVAGQTYFGMVGNYADPANSTSGAVAGQPTPGWDRRPALPGVPAPGNTAAGLMRLSGLRTLADLTGGSASIMDYATAAVDRVDNLTRSGYVLAYEAPEPAADGRYRAVRVEVNRKDVTLYYRHGYYALPPSPPMTRRGVMANGRIAAVALSTKEIRDLPVTLATTYLQSPGKGGTMLVQARIDATRLGWTTDELSRHVTHLDLAVYCGDRKQKVTGQVRRTVDIAFSDAQHQRALADGLLQTLQVPVPAAARYVKVIVYNYESNLTSSTLAAVK